MTNNMLYGVFFDVRNIAYVCASDSAEELRNASAYIVCSNEKEAREKAEHLNLNRQRKMAIA